MELRPTAPSRSPRVAHAQATRWANPAVAAAPTPPSPFLATAGAHRRQSRLETRMAAAGSLPRRRPLSTWGSWRSLVSRSAGREASRLGGGRSGTAAVGSGKALVAASWGGVMQRWPLRPVAAHRAPRWVVRQRCSRVWLVAGARGAVAAAASSGGRRRVGVRRRGYCNVRACAAAVLLARGQWPACGRQRPSLVGLRRQLALAVAARRVVLGGVLASPATPIPLKPPSSLLPSLLSLFLSLPSLGTSSWGRHASPFPSSFFLSSLFAASWHKLLGRPPPSS